MVRKIAITSLLLVTIALTNAQHKSFEEIEIQGFPGVSRGSVVWTDYDKDGLSDVFICGVTKGTMGNPTAELWRNLGNNKFERVESAQFAKVTHSSAAWADFNGDGYPDLIYCGTTSSNTKGAITKLYLNNKGTGTFTELEAPVLEKEITGAVKNVPLKGVWNIPNISIADYNNDGKPDILIAGNWNSGIPGTYVAALYRNNGDNTFTEINPLQIKSGKTDKFPGVYFTGTSWIDFDKDGYPDLIITGNIGGGPRNQIARLFKNNGDETFSEVSDKNAPFHKVYKSTVNTVDFDGNGYEDVFITGTPGMRTYIASLYKNQGDGTLQEIPNTGIEPVCDASVVWFDYDGDGKIDVLIAGFIEGTVNKSLTQLYKNNGNGTFSKVELDLPALYYPIVSYADINADGLPDFTISGYTKDSVTGDIINHTKVYINKTKQ